MDQKAKNNIENSIKANDISSARQALLKIRSDSVPENECVQWAQLARRAGLNKLSLSFLHRVVYETKNPSVEQTIEYASSIRGLGLYRESDRLLQVYPKFGPALLYRSFGYIECWNYLEAHECLVQCLGDKTLAPDQRLVAQVNLAASLIYLKQFQDASHLLNSLYEECRRSHHQLFINCHFLKGQIHWYAEDYRAAKDIFFSMPDESIHKDGYTSWVAKKWQLLSKLSMGELREDAQQISEFRKVLRREQQWETLRHLDWQMGKIERSEPTLRRVFYGTPFDSIKKRMTEECGSFEAFTSLPSEAKLQSTTDMFFGLSDSIDFGKLEHRLALILLSDQYRPWTIFRIFDSLYPDERYNAVSSGAKVYRILNRLRKILNNKFTNLDFKSTKSGYRLRPSKGSAVRVARRMRFENFFDMSKFVIEIKFGKERFRSTDLQKMLNLHLRTCNRILQELEGSGDLLKVAAGKSRFYELK